MKLADLIDLEFQLEADRALDLEALRVRDREIGLQNGGAEATTSRQLLAWLEGLRQRGLGHGQVGPSVLRGARWLAALLVVLGLLAGSGTARVLLFFDGDRPVNVLPILGILVLLQIGLLLLVGASVALTLVMPGLAGNLPLVGDLRSLLRALSARLADLGRRRGGSAARAVTALHRLRARSALHQRVEVWWMTLIAQSFGIAFNAGALAVLLILPSVLKYSFCWSTTLDLGPLALHRLTSALASAWSFVLPAAVPPLGLIEATQFDLLARAYAGGARPGSEAWWPFLLAAVVCYGLLPRIVLAAGSAVALRRALTRIPFDTPDVAAVLRRLRLPLVETQGQAPSSSQVARPGPSGGAAVVVSALPAGECVVVAWRELQLDRTWFESWLRREFGWTVGAVLPAGGADFAVDRTTIRTAVADGLPVAVAAEAFEPPDKAVRHFLAELRHAARPATHVLVALIGASGGAPAVASEQDCEIWSAQLAALEDAYLSVQSVGPPA
jgi:hypothetical protein